jgi:hypothetical protein
MDGGRDLCSFTVVGENVYNLGHTTFVFSTSYDL